MPQHTINVILDVTDDQPFKLHEVTEAVARTICEDYAADEISDEAFDNGETKPDIRADGFHETSALVTGVTVNGRLYNPATGAFTSGDHTTDLQADIAARDAVLEDVSVWMQTQLGTVEDRNELARILAPANRARHRQAFVDQRDAQN
ncbi:hypothetical protein [Agromyces humi]|uniref:hypothetical protein n=1 Tax=Agromyces humi TaxID=1766800 RepID=UPI00135B856A|nr:hypothetical protein [Agromyces humi]